MDNRKPGETASSLRVVFSYSPLPTLLSALVQHLLKPCPHSETCSISQSPHQKLIQRYSTSLSVTMALKPHRASLNSNIFRSVLLLAILLLSPSNAQAVKPDIINFSTIGNWADLKTCLQKCFGSYGIQYTMECKTNACLCRPDTLGDAIEKVYLQAFSSCSAIQDQMLATSILINYCSVQGSTSIIKPTILAAPGSSKSCIAQYITVYRNDSYSSQAVILGRGFEVFVAVLFLSIGMAMLVL